MDGSQELGPAPDAAEPVVGVVVTGDNHLAQILSRLPVQRRAARSEWLRRGFLAAVDYAIAHDAALFINTGDLFDNPTPSNLDRAFVAAQFARLARAGIVSVAIGGNHDTPRLLTEHSGAAPQQVYTALDGFHYFPANDQLDPLLFTLRGLPIVVAGLTNNPVASPGSDPLASARLDSGAASLATAATGLLVLHAAIEDLSRPSEGERLVTRASIEALPAIYQTIVAGHIHRYARQRLGERDVFVVGSTERMEFGPTSGAPGFVWLELGANGVRRSAHIRTQSQPRVEITLSAHDLWPDGMETNADKPLAVMRAALESQADEQALARLRLAGETTRDQYHQLALREIILFGQRRYFWLDIDTSGLTILDPVIIFPASVPDDGVAPHAPADVLRQTLSELTAQDAAGIDGAPSADDAIAAVELLLASLRDLDALDTLEATGASAAPASTRESQPDQDRAEVGIPTPAQEAI
jgi:DNA repair exonuclease SbcCD nuclease subunit